MDVPQQLAARAQWILWRYEGTERRKIPYQPNGRKAKTNDPATWSTLAECQAVVADYSGLGFVFAPDDGMFGVDLDGCRNSATGEIATWAESLLADFATYAEISPSGTGVKLYGAGVVPLATGKKTAIDKPAVCDKAPAIEVYDRGRYFAFTGDRLSNFPADVRGCQPQLNALCDLFWGEPEPMAPPSVAAPSGTGSPLTIADRAARYLQKLPPAVSGQGGHNATFRAACVLVLGFGLPIEDAFPVLAGWNAGCTPPWSDKELWHKLGDAAKRTEERGWLLEGRGYTGPDVNLRMLLGDVPAEVVSQQVADDSCDSPELSASDEAGGFPVDCLAPEGLLKEIVDHTLATSLYPQPEMALAAAIALLATVTGRKVTDTFGTRTNVYILALGLSGVGKEHARAINKDLLLRSGGERMIGSERVGSHAGIVTTIHDNPACLMQLDEMGRLLETMKDPRKAPHLFNCITVLMQLYSSSKGIWKADAYADAKKVKTVDQPHLVIYGTATPDSFWRSLSTDNIAEGLVGRLLVFEGRGYEVELQEPALAPAPEWLLAALRWWVEFKPGDGNLTTQHPTPKVIPHTPEARDRLLGHIRAINERRRGEQPLRAALWSRSGEKVTKLALIHACARARSCPSEITRADVDWGIKLANWLTRRMLLRCADCISENDVEARAKRVLALVGGREVSANEICRKTQWLDGRARAAILADLVHCGLLECEEVKTAGRTKLTYRRPQKLRQ